MIMVDIIMEIINWWWLLWKLLIVVRSSFIANLVNTWTSLLASEKTMDKMFSTILSNLFIVLMMEQLVGLEIIVGETFIPTLLMIWSSWTANLVNRIQNFSSLPNFWNLE